MSGFLDTSVTVRYLSRDPVETALKAAELIQGTDPLYITNIVLAETAYVLRSFYGIPRANVVDALVDRLAAQFPQLVARRGWSHRFPKGNR